MIFKSIAFDLDGTLVDSASLVGEILNSMRREKGLDPLGPDVYRTWSSRGGTHLVGNALAVGPERAGPLVDEFRRRYFQLPTPAESVFPGAREMLRCLTNSGRRLAICSNKPQRLCHKVLEETHLIHFFHAIVGGDTLDKAKPDPKPLRYALSCLEARTETALMVGDSVVDQQTATAAGVRFGFFAGGYDDGVVRQEAFHIFGRLDEFVPMVARRQDETHPTPRPRGESIRKPAGIEQLKSVI